MSIDGLAAFLLRGAKLVRIGVALCTRGCTGWWAGLAVIDNGVMVFASNSLLPARSFTYRFLQNMIGAEKAG